MKAKSRFYYDFYFMGKFINRSTTLSKAKKNITWAPCLTYPKNLYEIKEVLVLSTQENK